MFNPILEEPTPNFDELIRILKGEQGTGDPDLFITSVATIDFIRMTGLLQTQVRKSHTAFFNPTRRIRATLPMHGGGNQREGFVFKQSTFRTLQKSCIRAARSRGRIGRSL